MLTDSLNFCRQCVQLSEPRPDQSCVDAADKKLRIPSIEKYRPSTKYLLFAKIFLFIFTTIFSSFERSIHKHSVGSGRFCNFGESSFQSHQRNQRVVVSILSVNQQKKEEDEIRVSRPFLDQHTRRPFVSAWEQSIRSR